jgi:hypothetical protein
MWKIFEKLEPTSRNLSIKFDSLQEVKIMKKEILSLKQGYFNEVNQA